MHVPVVRVVWDNPDGFCEINESDFDPNVHVLFQPEKKPAREKKSKPQKQE